MIDVPGRSDPAVVANERGDGISASRSAIMARVRQKHAKPELIVRRALHAAGFRFRLHRRDLPGSPDIVLPSRRTVVFVHGCFWHRHPGCKAASTPGTRTGFWNAKFAANVARDGRAVEALTASGWSVRTVWECETKKGAYLQPLLDFLADRAPIGKRAGTPAADAVRRGTPARPPSPGFSPANPPSRRRG